MEIQRTRIGVRANEVDLGALWLTAYDYDILTALDMRLKTDLDGLEQVKTAFSRLGFELKFEKLSQSGVYMSNKLKEAILWIAENRGRMWDYEILA
jgi:hypothetical protein